MKFKRSLGWKWLIFKTYLYFLVLDLRTAYYRYKAERVKSKAAMLEVKLLRMSLDRVLEEKNKLRGTKSRFGIIEQAPKHEQTV